MLDDHGALGQALGPRRPDVVLTHRLEHAGPGEPGVLRREQQRERDPGQQQGVRPLDRVVAELGVRRTRWRPAELVAEEDQGDQAGPEDRHRDAGQGDGHRDPVEDRAPLEGGDDTDGEAEDQPDDGRTDGQRHRDRKPPLDLGQHGRAGLEGVAEARRGAGVAAAAGVDRAAEDDAVQPVPVLHRDRVVEAQGMGRGLELLGVGGAPDVAGGHRLGRGARETRDQVEDREGDHADHDHETDCGDEPSNDVGEHVGAARERSRPGRDRDGTALASGLHPPFSGVGRTRATSSHPWRCSRTCRRRR